MDLDITIHKGDLEKPAVIFIHGLGVDKGFWTDPVNTMVLGKSIPMSVFAAKKPKPRSIQKGRKLTVGIIPGKIENLWTSVINNSFNTVCWSQRRSVGPISSGVEELDHIVRMTKGLFPGNAIALVGHSRGGLIARKFMEKTTQGLKALITVATPHAGSSLSHLRKYLSPLSPALKKILPEDTHGAASETVRRVYDLLDGQALKELLPGSDFINKLDDSPVPDIKYLSFGGTETKLLTVYTWMKQDYQIYPKVLLAIPDSLLKILPSKIIPDEITPGKGDFMVTAESSVMPWSSKHYDLPSNHISISWNKKVINKTLKLLEEI